MRPARAGGTNVPYLDAAGNPQTAATATDITSATCGATLTDGWYVVSSDVTCNATITISGSVNLILADGHSLSVTGINVSGANSLTIYAQSTGPGMGSLTANGGTFGAGIGVGYNQSGGAITINGGVVMATGGSGGAGIGGGRDGNGGAITLAGGEVHATGGASSAGIGGGSGDGAATQGASGDISITGSAEVTATGGDGSGSWGGGAGIGSGAVGDVGAVGGLGTIIISTTGTVTATGGGPGSGATPGQGGAAIGTGGSATDAGTPATFYTATATAGAGGAIAPASAKITSGGNLAYAITPASGYAMATVMLDGTTDVTSAVSGGSYTLDNVTANHVIAVTFAPIVLTLSATAGANGGITGPATVLDGQSATYTITPDSGYVIGAVTLDGGDVTASLAGDTLTLDNVTANHVIAVTFVLAPTPLGNGSATSVPALGDAGLALLALLLAGGAAVGMRRGALGVERFLLLPPLGIGIYTSDPKRQ